MASDLVVVGVLARIEAGDVEGVKARLAAIPGVETFDLPEPEPGKLGVLIEASGVDDAHACLREHVDTTPGVLGTWPVALELDDEDGSESETGSVLEPTTVASGDLSEVVAAARVSDPNQTSVRPIEAP